MRHGVLGELLAEFIRATRGVRSAAVVSADGQRLAPSPAMGESPSDQLATAVPRLVGLASDTAALLGGSVRQTILEMSDGYLFLTALACGATLAVHADRSCNMGLVGWEMTMLASEIGRALPP